jgi:hypothetical protein
MVAGDGGHGLAPLGGELEDAVEQRRNIGAVVHVVAQERQASIG